MNTESFESFLQRSHFDYASKATWYLHGVECSNTSCPDCSCPPMYKLEKTKECCQKCNFPMMIWLFNEKQLKIWKAVRPPEKQEEEIEKAIREGKEVKIEQIIGEVIIPIASPSFLIIKQDII